MAGLGIYHYNARFYSPKLGRFLSPDTIVPNFANPQSWNRYSYVLNNPILYTDPTGHFEVTGNDSEAGCSTASCIIDMYSGYGDYEGMADSLMHYVDRHPDYNPLTDTELSDEEISTVAIAMLHADAQNAAEIPDFWDRFHASFDALLNNVGPVTLTAIIVNGVNMSPDGGGGGGYTPHKGYIDNLNGMSDRSLSRTIRSLRQNINEHLEKINNSPNSLAVSHWQKEIRNWQEELELALKEAAHRGIR